KSWIEKLPGPYTLILRLKNKDAVAENVNFGSDSLGVRIPNNWFSEVVTKMDVPIITTSANVAGHDFMTSLDDLDPVFREYVDYVIEQGELKGRPSTLIFLNKSKVEVKKR
ncbi:MAG: Sua5/YciO/YrdC/YwlC family protein, partial [Nanoarchaeota archaeon]|nr:Sua5/YciO/YrdC/YwlC family protein [Nanoarchaeota archaeon]